MNKQSAKILALAIVKAAVNDYNKALKQLETNPNYNFAISTKAEIERFFESNWFLVLCELNPDLTKIELGESK